MPLHPAKRLGGKEATNSGTATTTAATARSWETSSSKLTSRGQDRPRISQESDRNISHCESTHTQQVRKVLGRGPQTASIFHKGDPLPRAYRLQGLNSQGSTTTVALIAPHPPTLCCSARVGSGLEGEGRKKESTESMGGTLAGHGSGHEKGPRRGL